MADISLTRGQCLLPFVSILDDIGAPTDTFLERSRLPSSLVEKSDLYLPLVPALRFVETAQKSQGIEDFGFVATWRLHFSHMRENHRALAALPSPDAECQGCSRCPRRGVHADRAMGPTLSKYVKLRKVGFWASHQRRQSAPLALSRTLLSFFYRKSANVRRRLISVPKAPESL